MEARIYIYGTETPFAKSIVDRLELMDGQFVAEYLEKVNMILNDGTELNNEKRARLLKELEKCMEKNNEYNKMLIAKLKGEIKEAKCNHEK